MRSLGNPGLKLITTLLLSALAGLAHAQEAPPAEATKSGGRITGKVRFAGKIEPPVELVAHHDVEVCKKGGPLIDERRLIAADGGVANTVVVLQGMDAARAAEGAVATLDQRACRFVPHVQAVVQGTSLKIASSDPVLHNVHAFLGKRTAFNLAIPVPGVAVSRPLDEAGILRIRCDSGHTWMSAYIAVVPHAYFAVSDQNGDFSIADVPEGTYKLRAWHEDLGVAEQTVTVENGKDASTSFTFKGAEAGEPPPKTGDDELRLALAATRSAIETLAANQRAADRERLMRDGEPLFLRYCATCHGLRGDGQGPSAQFTTSPPRDFTRGTYKFRMTPAGAPPTLEDLIRTITVGVRGTHMPGWKGRLTRQQIRTLAQYLTTLSDVFWSDAPPAALLEIPPETQNDASSVARGKELYGRMQCGTCHGARGYGDGAAAAALRDDWAQVITPANFAQGVVKGGCCGAPIYRAISTGIGGTPMPSFGAAMSPEERWDLVHYVLSLRQSKSIFDALLDPAGRISVP
ncbi:MAG: c-type cytochrome [Myxococcota bacterium]